MGASRDIPPRLWWTKRLVVAGLVWTAVLAAAWWAWDQSSRRALERVLVDLRQRGEPTELGDFDTVASSVPDNAAPLWVAAGQAAERADWVPRHPNRISDWPQDAQIDPQKFAATDETFALARSAAQRHAAVWDVTLPPRPYHMILPELQRQRTVAQILTMRAFAACRERDVRQTFDIVSLMLRHADDVASCYPIVMAASSANAKVVRATAVLEYLPTLHLAQEPAAARAMIVQLLDEGRLNAGWQRAWQFQRQYLRELEHVYTEAFARITHPAVRRGVAVELERFESLLAAINSDEAIPTLLRLDRDTGAAPPPDLHLLERYPRAMEIGRAMTHFHSPLVSRGRALAARRAAAVRLAVALYVSDHDAPPATLSDLVPAYLPAVPVDPFDPARGPLRYVAGDRPYVYSVGKDGVDSGGSWQRAWRSSRRTELFDAPYPIDADPATLRQPVDEY